MTRKACLVLLSGGQDSTTSLYWAKAQGFQDIKTLSIDYGQRHHAELTAAEFISHLSGAQHFIVRTDVFKEIGDSALIGGGDISGPHRSSSNLPASFVPGRNILFLTIAAAMAFKFDINHLVTGVCQTDFSGYPDCRDNTIKSLQVALSLGLGREIIIHTPLMWLSKAESVKLAQSLPGCMEALQYSHTCYEGRYPPCGVCPACVLRARGFDEAGIMDPLTFRRDK